MILDPRLIILGGDIYDLPHVNELFLEPIIKNVKNTLNFNISDVKFSKPGEDAGIIGATSLAIDALLLKEFPYKIE